VGQACAYGGRGVTLNMHTRYTGYFDMLCLANLKFDAVGIFTERYSTRIYSATSIGGNRCSKPG
jgi:hypothetical protein